MLRVGDISFDSVLWFCLDGSAFFLGSILVVIASIIHHFAKRKLPKFGAFLIYAMALLAIGLSGTPLPAWLYLVWLLIFIVWLVLRIRQSKYQTLALLLVGTFSIAAMLLELPWRVTQTIALNHNRHVYVIGDSVSAGMGNEEEKTWPEMFGQLTGLSTTNLARAGATVETALKKQVSAINNRDGVVILEIGGNDLLGYTDFAEFETHADAMLASLSSHQTVWLELPLLPQHYGYGRIQRKLARKYKVTLLPKKVFVDVLKTKNATSDGIHLTQKGHEVMARQMADLFRVRLQEHVQMKGFQYGD